MVKLHTVKTNFISSCTVLSFYPLYTQNELMKDDRIIGQWQSIEKGGIPGGPGPFYSDTLIWNISFRKKDRQKEPNQPIDKNNKNIANQFTYTLNIYDKSNPADNAKFSLHLVKLGNQTYLDFFPEDWDINNPILRVHLMPVHTFAIITIGDKIHIQWLDSEWLKEMFDKNKIRIRHENNGNYTLLTAKPEELQKFIIKYSGNNDIFSDALHYRLKKIK